MKRGLIAYKILMVCLALGVVGAGVWAVLRGRVNAAASAPTDATDALAAIPPAKGGSATDREIARWMQKARQKADDGHAWVNLGDALMQKARETADASYYGHAERAIQKALALNPNNPSAMTSMARVCGSRHEFEKSREWANKAISLDAKNHAAYGLLGDADVEMGDYDAAFEHYQQMLDIRPDLSSYSRGAHLLYLNGDTRKGIWLMAKAAQAGSPHAENTAWCRAQLALMLWNNGALMAAENTLKAGLEKSPNNYHLLAAMGRVQASKKDYTAAIDYYKKALAVAPQIESLIALGDLYLLTGRKEEARTQFDTVMAIHKLNKANGVRDDIQIAQFYADHARNLPEALKIAEEEYKTRKNVMVADTLAWCYYKNGRYEEAQRMIRKALSRRTPDAKMLFHAGMIYAALKDRVTAQNYLNRALSLNPTFSPIYAQTAADTLKALGSTPPETKQTLAR